MFLCWKKNGTIKKYSALKLQVQQQFTRNVQIWRSWKRLVIVLKADF